MNAVILISGKISSGKNTLAQMIKDELESRSINVAVDSFAQPLKDMCKEAFTPLIDYLNERALLTGEDRTYPENWYENKNEITRHILQAVGTNIVRKINPNYWSESFVQRCLVESAQVIINSDCRFPSEIQAVQDAYPWKTLKVRVNRNLPRDASQHEHPSETALDNWIGRWDYVIDNNGTLDELKKSAILIADHILKIKGD